MPKTAHTGPVEIATGIFWVGAGDEATASPMNCNPYLIVDGEEAVLIDPGSPLDFESVLANVRKLVTLEQLRYIVLQHQDPDLCASTPLLEQQGFQGEIVTHWRTVLLVRFYGIKSRFYIVNEHEWQLTFGQDRKLDFVATPYLHFPGAISTYDSASKVLFTSDLFGAFAQEVPLYADEWKNQSYVDAMCNFHEHYMPSNRILRPVMEKFSKMDIAMLAPQHGSIIRRDIPGHIAALRELDCGFFLAPIQHELSAVDGYTRIATRVLKRFYSIYSVEQMSQILAAGGIKIDTETGVITDFNCSGRELWEGIFQLVYERNGSESLLIIEPLVRKLSEEYSLELPRIFQSIVYQQEQKNLQILQENRRLLEDSTKLTEKLAAASENLLRCPITQLRNEQVLLQYLDFQFQSYSQIQSAGTALFIGVDKMNRINLQFGSAVGNEVLRTIACLIDEAIDGPHALFKAEGPVFACCVPGGIKEGALRQAEAIRSSIEQSDKMIERLTVSLVAVDLSDFIRRQHPESEGFAQAVLAAARTQLGILRLKGGNRMRVCDEAEQRVPSGKIMLVDTDELHLEVLGTILTDAGYNVMKALDGEAALIMMEMELPDLIISEVMLPRLDGFLLRHRLKLNSMQQQIPFILLSFQKNEENIQRAFGLDIEHFFQKPYVLSELMGLIQLKFRQLSVITSQT